MVPLKRLLVPLLKTLIVVAVVYGIGRTVQQSMIELDRQEFSLNRLNPLWILISFLFCIGSQIVWGTYWQEVLARFGHKVPLIQLMDSYLLGQLGKYIPGKAMVLVLRSSKLLRYGVPISVSIVSIFLETLVMMAVGATIGGLTLFFSKNASELKWMALLLVIATATPTAPPLMRWCLTWIASRRKIAFDTSFLNGLDWSLIFHGWCRSGLGWVLTIISLWSLLRGMLPSESSLDWMDGDLWLACATAATLSVVAGFVSFLPGGAGVREYVLLLSLAPMIGEGTALAAAIGMRLVSITSELIGYSLFAMAARSQSKSQYNGEAK